MRLLLASCALLIAAAPSLPGQGTLPLTAAEVAGWRADLQVVRTQVPARHANAFHAITPVQFDSALTAIDVALPRLARHAVIVELMRLTALLGDGHSSVGPWRDTATAFHELPVTFYWFEDGVFIRATTTAQRSLLGARVVAIGGVPIADAIARMRPLVSRDNDMGVRARAPLLLSMPEVLHAVGLSTHPDSAVVTVALSGSDRVVHLGATGRFPMQNGDIDLTWRAREGWVDARDGAATPLWLSDPANLYWGRYLPDNHTWYWQLNTIQSKADDSLPGFVTRTLRQADSLGATRLVLDLRLNGGGNNRWNREVLRGIIKSRFDAPGRLYVITGRRTFSAAQMLISELEKYTEAIFVGEPSASRGTHYGDSFRIPLPNSHVTVRVSSLYWQFADPRDTRPWIPVTIAAPLHFPEYQAGHDPSLEAVLATARPE